MFNRENKKKEMEALALKQEKEGKKGESVMESFGIICYCVMTFFLEICGGWILTVLQDPVLLALAGVGVWAVGHVVEIVCAWAGTILGIILGIVSDWFGEVLGIVVTSLTESVGGKWVLDILGIISTALGAVLGIVSNWWAENLGWEWVDEWI
ncbi:hypothetical protein L873DRAFT_1813495 [Choiromyces venosus 120613-1]|uniref:Uncharacterized protein n=1 Tax=Choiromyces venosus 120613-1 TaxID=1336337 RepID=A0A3N4JES8_9PEZI|nr:hypothetical protein L873DRAFT_1813495 [Choiromyces venosus 120613-1]